MDSVFCYCLGALGAILKNVYHLNESVFYASQLPPSDDDDYSSLAETSDDEDPAPTLPFDFAPLPQQHPLDLDAPFTRSPHKITTATVAYAAVALNIVFGYCAPRSDDEDSDSSSDEDSDSGSDEDSDEASGSSDSDD